MAKGTRSTLPVRLGRRVGQLRRSHEEGVLELYGGLCGDAAGEEGVSECLAQELAIQDDVKDFGDICRTAGVEGNTKGACEKSWRRVGAGSRIQQQPLSCCRWVLVTLTGHR